MTTLCIFNPEHDLCLSNGSKNFMPPASALEFGRKCAHLMGHMYPDSLCVSVDGVAGVISRYEIDRVVPWGWNLTLVQQLRRQGVGEELLPSQESLDTIRNLQHRDTIIDLQPDVAVCHSIEDVECAVSSKQRVVMKSPLSGSGRGLRWVDDSLCDHDRSWLSKQLVHHGFVMVEPRRKVVDDFAFEYRLSQEELEFVGYSLFHTLNGVYRGNWLFPDEEIAERIRIRVGTSLDTVKGKVEQFLSERILGSYQGALGVDLMVCEEEGGFAVHVAEMNFRHTMGLVAHELLKNDPEKAGTLFEVKM